MLSQGDCGEPVIPRRKKHPDLAYRTNEWFGNCSSTQQPPSQKTKMTAVVVGSVNSKPKKSISMGTMPVHAPIHSQKVTSRAQQKIADGGMDLSEPNENQEFSTTKNLPDLIEDKVQGDMKHEIVTKRKEYKTEYKNRFRPFSQYEYVDGKFFKKDKDQQESTQSPWYAEVIELRKKAGEYKFRGWGTDLGSSAAADIFNHQHIWEQVSRRSSLAPLALITTTPRYTPKEEKDKRNAKKRLAGKDGFPRPHTATPKHAITEADGFKSSKDDGLPRKKKLDSASKKAALKVKARSQSAGPTSRSSPQKTTTRQPSAASSVSEKENVGGAGWKVASESDSKPKQRYIRPTTLATSPRSRASSGKGDGDANSKLVNQHRIHKNSADPSLGYSDSSVVKSPVEPTRVKSPDQAGVKSPDGVKWTVPLDTTKGFIVTQNIREGIGSDGVSSTGLDNSTQPKHSKGAVNGSADDKRAKKLAPILSNKSKALPPPVLKKTEEPVKVTLAGKAKENDVSDEAKKKIVSTGKPGAPLRCLDDPTFMFETTPSPLLGDKGKAGGKPQRKIPERTPPPPPKSSIRVLEAPVPAATVSTSKQKAAEPAAPNVSVVAVERLSDTSPQTLGKSQPKGSTYRVLEAPEKPAEKTAPSSKASDVLKKARHRFDKFWSKDKSKDEE